MNVAEMLAESKPTRFCHNCNYTRRVLVGNCCAECGGSFDRKPTEDEIKKPIVEPEFYNKSKPLFGNLSDTLIFAYFLR